MILDATAGNRHIWGENKHPEGVVFLDKEKDLIIPPDIVGTWDKIPFPDNYFDCILFDPPYYYGEKNAPPYFTDPTESRDPRGGPWYGYPFATKREMICEIYKAQKEFSRVSSRICFKWMEKYVSLNNILTVFDRWEPVFYQPFKAKQNFKNGSTWWVKLVRKSEFCTKNE